MYFCGSVETFLAVFRLLLLLLRKKNRKENISKEENIDIFNPTFPK